MESTRKSEAERESPGFVLWQASLRWQREVGAALRPLGLTHVQYLLLDAARTLSADGSSPSQRQLANHAGTDVMMTSQVLRVLEERGLVSRSGDGADARVRRVRVTTAGKRQVEKAAGAVSAVDSRLFGDSGSRLAMTLRRVLEPEA